VPRPKRRAAATGPVAELLALEAEAAAAAAGGDGRAVALLRQVHSWLSMLEHAGGDAEIAGLFAIFASEARGRLDEWWANPGKDGSHA
jgi:hypothetical protein